MTFKIISISYILKCIGIYHILLLFVLMYTEVKNQFYILSIIRGKIAKFAIQQTNRYE